MVNNGIVAAAVVEIRNIAGDKLPPAMCEEIAARIVKLIEDYNRTAALAAMETVKQTLTQAAKTSSDLEKEKKP